MTAFSASANAKPSVPLLVVFVLVTAAITVLGKFAATGNIPSKSLLEAGAVAVLAAVAAVLLCFAAEGIGKRAATS